MNILTGTAQAEITVKKSVFRAEVFYTEQAQEAREIIKRQKERYRDARHVVHAFVIGENGEIHGCSDDGEPPGTAGQPVLALVKGSGITNILVTVTRWFGGVLLGTGGLVKAYSDAVKAVLAEVTSESLIKKAAFVCECRYEDHTRVRHAAASLPVVVSDTEFSQSVILRGSIPVEYKEAFGDFITEVTKGQSAVRFLDERDSVF